MTDNEIIKALKELLETALYNGDLQSIETISKALKLIKHQKAEIERLEAEADKQYEQAEADILANMADGGTSCHWCIEQHKAKAIKEFAERLKILNNQNLIIWNEQIDNLVKETTGEKE